MTTIIETNANSNLNSNRFTKEEKTILFQLFAENEDIIDIKQRRICPKKHISIRDCWNRITDEFNSHPSIKSVRSLKQIQKFWLNARLRKSYPGGGNSNASINSERRLSTTESNNSLNTTKTTIIHTGSNLVNSTTATIKPPKLIRITSQQKDPLHYENIKYEKECEAETEIEMVAAEDEEEEEEEEEDLTQEVEISTSSNDVNMVESESQQYSIDHISTDKLTLNDLLEFKNGRNKDEIVLQIRTSEAVPVGTTTTNQIKDTSNTPQYTTSYRIAHPISQATIIQDHQFQTAPVPSHTTNINVPTQPAPQKIIHTSEPTNSPNYYTSPSNQNTTFRGYESFEDKLNYYQLKEAELKFKEGQIKIEKMKIDLQKSKDELKNLKELHALQVREMEMKLRLLAEEEKRVVKMPLKK